MEGNTMNILHTSSRVLKAAFVTLVVSYFAMPVFAQFENARLSFTNRRCKVVMIGSSAIEIDPSQFEGATCLATDQNNNAAAKKVKYTNITVGGTTYTHTSAASIDLNGTEVCNKKVTNAYLYWGGSRKHGSTDEFWTSTIKVAGPDLSFKNVTATAHGTTSGGATDDRHPYFAYADVTSQLAGQDAGTFYVKDVVADINQSSEEGGPCAAWALILIFDDPTYPVTDFYLRDGIAWLTHESNSGKTNIDVSGFSAPAEGEIGAFYGIATIDGDAAKNKHEYVTFKATGGTAVDLNALRGTQDFLASSITYNGAQVARYPDCVNTIGWDSHHMDIPAGSVPNGCTSARVTVDMTKDGNAETSLYPFMTYVGIIHEQPNVQLTKASSHGSVKFDQKYQYTIVATNYGGTPTDDGTAFLIDTIDANVHLIGATGNAKVVLDGVDVTSSCVITYNSSTRELRFSSLPAIPGGSKQMVFTYQVQVEPASREDLWRLDCNQAVYNRGHMTYTFETLNLETMMMHHATTNEATGAYSCNPQGEYTIVPITSTMPDYSDEFNKNVTEDNGTLNLSNYLRDALKEHLGGTDYSLGYDGANEFTFYTNDTYTTPVGGAAMLNIADGATQTYYAKRDFLSPVKEKGTCTETYTIHLKRVLCSLVLSKSVTPPLCNSAQATTASGVINVSVTDGNDPSATNGMTYYLYASDGTTLLKTHADRVSLTDAFSQLTPATYNVAVKDYLGCKVSESVVVADPDPIAITLTNDPNCAGQPSTLEATITAPAAHKSPSDYIFKWYRSADGGDYTLIDSVMGANTYSITSYDDRIYMRVEAYYANALCEDIVCKGTQTTSFEPAATPKISNTTDTVQIVCTGTASTPITLSAVSVIDPAVDVTSNTNFIWTQLSSTGVSGTVTLPASNGNVLAAQTLSVTGTDTGLVRLKVVPIAKTGSCEGDPITILLKVAPGPEADFSYDAEQCPNCKQTLTATVTKGKAPISYSWTLSTADEEATLVKDASCTNAQAVLSFKACSEPANVTLNISDANGCTTTQTHIITSKDGEKPTWTTAAGALDRTVNSCDEDVIDAARALKPEAEDNCSSPSLLATKVSLKSETKKNIICANSYDLERLYTVTDSCDNVSADYVQTIQVRDIAAPVQTGVLPAQNPVATGASCQFNYPDVRELARGVVEDACTAAADLTITQSPAQGSAIAVPTATTNKITVTVTDECANEISFDVAVNPIEEFAFSLSTTSATICADASVDLTQYYVKPASTGYTYTVKRGGSSVADPTAINTAGTYTVTCTQDATGCTQTADFVLTVNALPDVTINAPTPGCEEDDALTLASAGIVTFNSGSAADHTITFYSDPTRTTSVTTADYNISDVTTTYYITIVTKTTPVCSVDQEVDITINPRPTAPAVHDSTVCETEGHTVDWTKLAKVNGVGETLVWYDAETGGSPIVISPLDISDDANATSKWVAARNSTTGCESERAQVSVHINNRPAAPAVTTPAYSQCPTETATEKTFLSLVTPPVGSTVVWYAADNTTKIADPGTFSTKPAGGVAFDVTYYVAAQLGSCYSEPHNELSVHIDAMPAQPAVTNYDECAVASGANITWASRVNSVPTSHEAVWYNSDDPDDLYNGTGEEPASVPVTAASTKSYWVAFRNTSTTLKCAGPRTEVTITLKARPAVPTATDYSECATSGSKKGSVLIGLSVGASETATWYESDGVTPTTDPTVDLSTASNNTYKITSTDLEGCVSDFKTVNIEVKEVPAKLLTTSFEPCRDNEAGDAVVKAWSELITGNYNPSVHDLVWYDADGVALSPNVEPAAQKVNTALAETFYQVAAKTKTGACEGEKAQLMMHITELPETPTPPATLTVCAEDDAQIAWTDVVGAAPAGYTINWYAGPGKTNPMADNDPGYEQIKTAHTATMYYTFVNGNDCESPTAAAATLTVNAKPNPSVANEDVCKGGDATLNATDLAGTTISTYKWESSPDGLAWATVAGATTSSLAVTGATATTYYKVTMTNSNGCEASGEATLTVNELPTILTGDGTVCRGSDITLTADHNPSATTPWRISNSTDAVTVSGSGKTGTVTGQEPTGSNPSIAQIVYVDENECQSTPHAVSSVVCNDLKISVPAPAPSPVCLNEETGLTIKVENTTVVTSDEINVKLPVPSNFTITAQTPSGTTTYDAATGIWNVGVLAAGTSATLQLTVKGVTENTSIPSTIFVSKLGARVYADASEYTVDEESMKTELTFTVKAKPVVTITPAAAACGGSVDVSTTVSGATTYKYYSDALATVLLGSTSISEIGTTNYYVVGTTDECPSNVANGSVTIYEPTSLTLTSDASTTDQTLCSDDATITDIVYTVGGGATGATVTGLPAGVTGTYNSVTKKFTISGEATATGTFNYTVTTTGATAPCVETELTGTITINDVPTIVLTSGANEQTFCQDAATITDIVYTVGGGATGATVTGLPTGVTGTYNSGTKTFTLSGTATEAGVFNYTVTTTGAAAPCVNPSLTGTLTINASVTAEAGDDQTVSCICGGNVVTVTMAATNPAVGTGKWTLKSTTSSAGTITDDTKYNTTITNLPIGTHVYTWTVTNGATNACEASDDVTITVEEDNVAPTFTLSQDALTLTSINCTFTIPNLLTYVATKSDNCTSSGDLTVAQSKVAGTTIVASTTVDITVTDLCGNVATKTFTLTVPTSPTVSVTPSDGVTCSGATDGMATATVTGGTGAYTYAWSTGSTNAASVADLAAGDGTLTVTDENGCTATDDYTIADAVAITGTASGTNLTTPISTDGKIDITATAGGFAGATYIYELRDNTDAVVTNNASVTYSFAANGTNTSFTDLSEGTYKVIAKNVKAGKTFACEFEIATLTISQPSNIAGTNVVTNLTCNANNTGNITVKVTEGGTAPYKLQLEKSDNTIVTAYGATVALNEEQAFSGLAAGTYQVRVKDATDYTALVLNNIIVTEPAAIEISEVMASHKDVKCKGNATGELAITATGGTKATDYTYSWSNGLTTAAITGLTAGDYTVTVTDDNACSANTTLTVTEPTALSVSVTPGDGVTCSGATDGMAAATVTGGTGAYTYAWSTGSTNAASVADLAAGDGTLTVTDANGCTVTDDYTIANAVTITGTTSKSDLTTPVSTDGKITVTATTGGFDGASYIYELRDNTDAVVTNNASVTYSFAANGANIMFTDLSKGTYKVIAKNVKAGKTFACEFEIATLTINQPSNIKENTTVENLTCNANNTGKITIRVTEGGTAPYKLQLEKSDNTIVTAYGATVALNESKAFSGLAAGTYQVRVKDASDYETILKSDIVVTEPAAISISEVSASHKDVKCNGNATGELAITATGGTKAGDYNYSWNNGLTTAAITGLTAGDYTVTVTDDNACSANTTLTVTEPTALSVSVTPGDGVTCSGATDGMATATVTGGTGAYTYAWSTGSTNAASVADLAAGAGTLTVTDANGCTATGNYTITDAVAITGKLAFENLTTPESTDGEVSVVQPLTSAGFDGASVEYELRQGSTVIRTYSSAYEFTGLAEGVYQVYAKNVKAGKTFACEYQIGEVSITQPSNIAGSYTTVNLTCNNNNTGKITVKVTDGGTAPYQLQLEKSDNTIVSAYGATVALNVEQEFTGLEAGTYQVRVKDASAYTAKFLTNIKVTEPAAISVSEVAASHVDVKCKGNATGELSITATGGTKATDYTYSWSNGAATAAITGLTAGDYTVTVTDDNHCSANMTLTVDEPTAALSVTIPSKTDNVCHAGDDGDATASAAGGTPSYTYKWYRTADALKTQIANTATATNLTADNYTVLVTDANGCTAEASETIDEPATGLDLVSSTVTPVSCNGGNDGTAEVVMKGGSGSYTYSWTNGSTASIANGLTAGDWTVTVLDVADVTQKCPFTKTLTVEEPEVITLTTDKQDQKCYGAADAWVEVSATGGNAGSYEYDWSTTDGVLPAGITTGVKTTTNRLEGVPAGTYNVTVYDSKNCTQTTSITVTPATQMTYTSTSVDVLCGGGNTGQLTVNVSGGAGSYTYEWYEKKTVDGSTTETKLTSQTASTATYLYGNKPALHNGTAYAYYVKVKDANECVLTSSDLTVNEPDALVVDVTKTDNTCATNELGTATATVTGGTAPYTYQWTVKSAGGNIGDAASATQATVTGLKGSEYGLTYNIRVTDAKGCTPASASKDVTILTPTPIVLTTSYTDATCNGLANGTASVSVTGGSGSYTYSWNNGATAASLTGLTANTYTVIVADAADASCTKSVDVTIGQPDVVNADVTANNIECAGANNGSITISNFKGGNGSYNYTIKNSSNETVVAKTTWLSSVTTDANLKPDTYTVTLSDGNTCDVVKEVTIVELYAPLKVTSVVVSRNETCPSSADAQVKAFVEGGNTASRTFAWATSMETIDQITTSESGSGKTVTVTDASGCTASATYTVEPASDIIGIATVTQNATAWGRKDGIITVQPGTTGGYNSSLYNNSEITQNTTYLYALTYMNNGVQEWIYDTDKDGVFSGLAPNIEYTVMAKSVIHTIQNSTSAETENDCDCWLTLRNTLGVDQKATLPEPLPAMGTITKVQDITCHDANDASATVTITKGGQAPYNVTLNGVTKTIDALGGSATYEGLSAQTYTAHVVDGAGLETDLFKENSTTEVVTLNTIVNPAKRSIGDFSTTAFDVCDGQTITVTAKLDDGSTPVSITWSEGSTTGNTLVVSEVGDHNLVVRDAVYVSETGSNCQTDNEKNILVKVHAIPEMPAIDNYLVCEQTSGTKNWTDLARVVTAGSHLKWYGGVSENNPGTIDLTTPGTSTRTVLAEMNGCQSAMVTVEAEVRETPSFASLVHLEDLTTEVTLNNSALDYTYVLDEGRTAPSLAVHDIRQSEGSFTGSGNLGMLTVGMHTLKVTDNAGCSCDTTFKVTGAPLVPDKFFTPNNDGVNDKWLIHGGIGRYPESKIYLYDRYGKQLATFTAEDFDGWDGKYNGKDMPSTDYWYIIEVKETGERLVGHFLLKR